MQNIKEKGASSGLGEATARLLAAEGATVVLVRDGLNVSKHWLTS